MKKLLLTFLYATLLGNVLAQTAGSEPKQLHSIIADSSIQETVSQVSRHNPGRKWLAGGLAIAGLGGSLSILMEANNYQYNKNFNTINDARSWLQMDKTEHLFLSYTTARYLSGLGKWAGFSPQNAVLLASGSSLIYLSTKEYLDGHHANWGWSWSDMGANILGTTLFASQELAWHEQKIQFKFSALPKRYEPTLNNRADNLFGQSKPERILKDYNAQTYWLSFNLKAISRSQNLPDWLNLAVGYGGAGLFGPYENVEYTNGRKTFDRTDLPRSRQWYFSPDIDVTKIKTNKKTFKTFLIALNAIKVPLPTLAFSNQRIKGHWLHF